MARRMNLSIRPVQRIKHVVDISNTPAANAQTNNVLIVAKDAPVIANTAEVQTGSKVNGIYLKVVVSCKTGVADAIPNVYMTIQKNVADDMATPAVVAIGSNVLKRTIIHQEMVMIDNRTGGVPTTLFNGVIVIPKGMRRFGPDDKLYCSINSPSMIRTECLQCHYKEFK